MVTKMVLFWKLAALLNAAQGPAHHLFCSLLLSPHPYPWPSSDKTGHVGFVAHPRNTISLRQNHGENLAKSPGNRNKNR